MEHLYCRAIVPDKRCKRDALRVVFVADMEVAEEHAQWRTPEIKPDIEASRSSAVEGVEAVISAWVAGECN